MKGPLESRHTSSERARTPAREHARLVSRPGRAQRAWAGARSERVSIVPVSLFHPRLLRAPDVLSCIYPSAPPRALNLRLDHGRCHSENDARP